MFTWKFKMAAIFEKLYMSIPIHKCIDRSNPLGTGRDVIFLKIFVIPGGNTPPTKSSWGDTSATLPNRNRRYQGTTCTSWLNFYTPCKSHACHATGHRCAEDIPGRCDVTKICDWLIWQSISQTSSDLLVLDTRDVVDKYVGLVSSLKS